MTLTHESFEIERELGGSRDTVWAAWADPDLKRRWFVDSDGPEWSEKAYALDFRVGGTETGRFELAEGPGRGPHENVTHYLDIRPKDRIVYAYTMALDGRIHSASLATVTFADAGGGTRLVYHEQGTFYEESDGAQGRRGGWEHLLTALANSLRVEA